MTAQDVRICFIGDSFTNGTGDETCLGWAGHLSTEAITDERTITYYNLGIRRNTSKDILQRWEQECAQRLQNILAGIAADAEVVIGDSTLIGNGFSA